MKVYGVSIFVLNIINPIKKRENRPEFTLMAKVSFFNHFWEILDGAIF
jgi:hypothetical protein